MTILSVKARKHNLRKRSVFQRKTAPSNVDPGQYVLGRTQNKTVGWYFLQADHMTWSRMSDHPVLLIIHGKTNATNWIDDNVVKIGGWVYDTNTTDDAMCMSSELWLYGVFNVKSVPANTVKVEG